MHRVALAAFGLMVLFHFVLGSSPDAAGLLTSPVDKIAHFFVYFVMTLLVRLGLPRMRALQAGLVAVFVGGVEEVYQIWLPGRNPGIDDFGANLLGILFALVGISLMTARKVYQ